MENNDDDLSRIMKMNDRYKFEKITQQSLLKELNEYNEKEAEEKKQKMKELKESQYKEYIEKLNSINTEKEITKIIKQMIINIHLLFANLKFEVIIRDDY